MAFLTNSLNAAVAGEQYRDPIVAGIANAIQEIQPWYEFVPWVPVRGTSLAVQQQADTNLSSFVADGADLDTGDMTIQVSTTPRNFNLTPIAGTARVGAMAQAGGSASGTDLMAAAIAAKANDISRKIWTQVVRGTTGGSGAGFSGFEDFFGAGGSHNSTAREIAVDADTSATIMDKLDEMLNQVAAKSGSVDWIQMNGTMMNVYRARVRALGGAFEYVTSPITNRNVLSYQGIPVFQNNNITLHDTDQHELYAGTFESGGSDGCAMLYPEGTPAGISVVNHGDSERYLGQSATVSQFVGFAVMNDLGLARTTVDVSANTGL